MKGVAMVSLLLALCATSCSRVSPNPSPEMDLKDYRWDGKPALSVRSLDRLEPMGPGFDEGGGPDSIVHLSFADWDTVDLQLKCFASDEEAFRAFQQLVPEAQALSQGYFSEGAYTYFRQRAHIGQISYRRKGLLTESAFIKRFQPAKWPMPSRFQAFPVGGRLKHSERIHAGNFLGVQLDGPLYSVRYPCLLDTAWALRIRTPMPAEQLFRFTVITGATIDTLSWGRDYRLYGSIDGMGLELWSRPAGITGILNCSDAEIKRNLLERLNTMTAFFD